MAKQGGANEAEQAMQMSDILLRFESYKIKDGIIDILNFVLLL